MRFAVAAVCSALLLTGCTGTPAPSPSPTRTPDATSAAALEPVGIPTRLAHEISRDVYTGTAYDGSTRDVPRGTTELQLHAACAGPAGTEMRWQIQDGRGTRYSAGTVTCDGQEQVDIDQSRHFPESPVVHLDAPATALDGYAILTGS